MEPVFDTPLSRVKLTENLRTQLSELEMLESMFYNPGEIRVDDFNALREIRNFVNGTNDIIPPFLDITINLSIENLKYEFCINLSHEYPDVEPDIYIRNHKLNREQHAKINKGMSDYIGKLEKGEVCIFSAISWLQDNASCFVELEEEVPVKKVEESDELIRLWIYSHHIYSKTKRREIVDLASQLKLTGFCLPGKPGVICVEGYKRDCEEWWQAIKSMNWKRIFCKISEECKGGKEGSFLKFDNFEEKIFQNRDVKCNHMDMGELHKFLGMHNCDYIFKDLFGVDSRNNSAF